MIVGFDHVVIAVRDLAAATTSYEILLGHAAIPQQTRDGVATAILQLENIAVELIAPIGDGEGARRLSAALEDGDGLKSLVFAAADIERAHLRCERVGLAPAPIVRNEGVRASFRTNTARAHGVRVFLIEADTSPKLTASVSDDSVRGLDHVVVRSPDLDRAAALYGGRLGLDMRLDREVRGQRLMFFRCGDAVVEIAQDAQRETDLLWGLSWRVANADAARERLAGAGVDASEVRQGMKPGTRVFTVRDGTCGVPTLMIEQAR